MFIQTISDDNKVLGLNGDEVILELKDSKKAGQLWIKGEDRSGCYFTLKNNESSKVLTAISGNSLKAKGNSKDGSNRSKSEDLVGENHSDFSTF